MCSDQSARFTRGTLMLDAVLFIELLVLLPEPTLERGPEQRTDQHVLEQGQEDLKLPMG